MRKVLISLLILSALLSTNCLMSYYSAQLPEPGKMHVGIGGSYYKQPINDFYWPSENIYLRVGLPYECDIGLTTFWGFYYPYAVGTSVRKQVTFSLPKSNFLKANFEAGISAGLAYGYNIGISLSYKDLSFSSHIFRCNHAIGSDIGSSTEIYNSIDVFLSYDWSINRFHVVPFVICYYTGTITSSMVSDEDRDEIFLPVYKYWNTDYSKPNFTGGITVYFNLL